MNSLYHYCQGFSHKATDKPCQDCAYAENSPELSMAIVSDGHGGARYFRSDKGSTFAVEIAKESIHEFVNEMKENPVFQGRSFTAYGVELPEASQKDKALQSLKWLVSSIISKWNARIVEDATARPLTEWENQHVEEKYRIEFEENVKNPEGSFEKTYGCTLMVYVQTPDYWFAFHIGDGKAVFFNVREDKFEPSQLIPWDEKCFLNKTTSICDSDAVNEFRYCFCGDGTFPDAVFLGSDGMDDTYGDGDKLTDFYIKFYKEIARTGKDTALKTLEKVLPKISAIGSKDDMSIACVYNEANLTKDYFLMSAWQMEKLQVQEYNLIAKSDELKVKIEGYGDEDKLNSSERINLNYARKDLERTEASLKRIESQKHGLKISDGMFRKQIERKES